MLLTDSSAVAIILYITNYTVGNIHILKLYNVNHTCMCTYIYVVLKSGCVCVIFVYTHVYIYTYFTHFFYMMWHIKAKFGHSLALQLTAPPLAHRPILRAT